MNKYSSNQAYFSFHISLSIVSMYPFRNSSPFVVHFGCVRLPQSVGGRTTDLSHHHCITTKLSYTMSTATTSKKQHSKKRQKTKTDYYQIVTDRIIALLEQGVPPWRKTWGNYGLARNYATGHVYSGINMLMLNLVAPYDIPLYMSRKQLREKGGTIKKGSRAEWVYYYGDYHKDADGKTVPKNAVEQREQSGEELQHIRFLKAFPVYNVSCIEGIEIDVSTMPARDNTPIEECETFLQNLTPSPNYTTKQIDRAYYNATDDCIRVPDMKYFEASEEYYATLFHEIVHWTGHSSRLNRTGIVDDKATFGTKLYSEEELIAEMGASYLCALTGIDREALVENSAAYINGWMKRLKDDKKLIFRVAAKAQQAIDFLTTTD